MTLSADLRERLREGVDKGNIPTLLMVLVQLTGDLSWLESPYRPTRARGMGDNPTGGLTEGIQHKIRDAAFDAIVAWKEGAPMALPKVPNDLLVRMLSVSMGEEVAEEYGEFTAAQLGQEPLIDASPVDVPEGFKVLVVGAGISGLCCAVYLKRAGIPYVVVEKAPTVGGVWWENRYPGCGVDSPNHLYSFSFAPNDWSAYFVLRDELCDYFERVSREFGLRDHIRFDTELRQLTYDEATQTWVAQTRGKNGEIETDTYNVVLSGVGLFNPPVTPNIEGLNEWTAEKWHTARWPSSADLNGKRVGIIGTGATSMQIGPAIAAKVKSLTIFQRDRHWVAPHEQFHTPVPESVRFLFNAVPIYRDWYRARLGWSFNDRMHNGMFKDPDWPHPERSVNRVNEIARVRFTEYIKEELGDQVDKHLAKVLPDYPPFGKRILLDNGWFRMLTRDNVELVTDPIARCDGNKVVTRDGTAIELDVLVLATGFGGQKMIDSYEVIGRGGRSLRDEWGDDDPKAYLGTMVPAFPNFFVLYGPNLQPGHGGSMTFSLEMQVRYVMDVLREMLRRDLGAVEVRQNEYEAYNDKVDGMHEKMLWTHPGVSTYYRNKAGRVVINSPWRNVDFYQMTQSAELEKYEVEPARRKSPTM